MASRIVLRRSLISEWTAANPILGEFEIGIETDPGAVPKKAKLGDGETHWNDLPYWNYSGMFGTGDVPQYDEILATSDGQSVFSFPSANGKYIISLHVESIKIPRSRFTHVGDNITLTLASDIEAVETNFEICLWYQDSSPPIVLP